MLANREECDARRVVAGSGFRGCVDDRENCVARPRIGERPVVSEQFFAAEERDTRPVDKLGEVLLGIDQGIIVLDQVGLELRPALQPAILVFVPYALRKKGLSMVVA